MLRAGGPDWQRVLGYVESIYRHFEMWQSEQAEAKGRRLNGKNRGGSNSRNKDTNSYRSGKELHHYLRALLSVSFQSVSAQIVALHILLLLCLIIVVGPSWKLCRLWIFCRSMLPCGFRFHLSDVSSYTVKKELIYCPWNLRDLFPVINCKHFDLWTPLCWYRYCTGVVGLGGCSEARLQKSLPPGEKRKKSTKMCDTEIHIF